MFYTIYLYIDIFTSKHSAIAKSVKCIYISKIFTSYLKITDNRRFTEISTISCSSVLITLYDENIFNPFVRFRNL